MSANGELELHVEGPDMAARVYAGRWHGDEAGEYFRLFFEAR